jgi:hypothetical protein
VGERPFPEKTWSTKFAQPFFDDARAKLEKERQAHG